MTTPPVPDDCTKCGRCCQRYDWIAVTEEEVVILANYFQDLSFLARDRHGRPLFAEGTFSMKIVEGKCCMLKDKKCSIYNRCPAVCRKFSVGGRQCKEVLRRTP